jgi:cytosine/adenosine deaminase-related metal-dependent hydrolase
VQFGRKQTREAVLYGGLAGIIEQARSGVSTIFDYHTSSNGSRSSLATLADAFSIAGVRGCLSLATRDPENGSGAQAAFKETENFLKWCRRERLPNIKGMVGVHRSLTCSDDVLEVASDMATRMGVGIHLEMAPDPADVQDCLSRFGMRVAQRMHDFGVVGPETVAASCVQANEDEIDILRNSETVVGHTPSVDLSRGRQTAPVLTMLRRGIRVGIGTGGEASNPLAEVRLSRLLHSHVITQPGEGEPDDFLRMVFTENARLAGSVFGFRLGQIAEKAVADIAAFRVPLPEGITESRWAAPLLFSLAPMARAEHLVVGGNLVLRDGVLQTVEEDEILEKAREVAQSLG